MKKAFLIAFVMTFLMMLTPVAASTVTHYGMNSCSKGWYHTGGTFLNYCPNCHAHGALTFNPKGTIEGEWTCSACDADYCLCGKEKISGGLYLVKASKEPKQVKITPPTPPPAPPTPLEIIKDKIHKPILGTLA